MKLSTKWGEFFFGFFGLDLTTVRLLVTLCYAMLSLNHWGVAVVLFTVPYVLHLLFRASDPEANFSTLKFWQFWKGSLLAGSLCFTIEHMAILPKNSSWKNGSFAHFHTEMTLSATHQSCSPKIHSSMSIANHSWFKPQYQQV